MLNKKLIFIQSTYGDAHQMIRYQELKKHYKESVLLAFERLYYDSTQDLNFISLGQIDHGRYFNRFSKYLYAVKTIKNQQSKELNNDIFFYGFDLLPFISLLINQKKSKLIFEILDIREVYFKRNVMSKLLLQVLKSSIKKVSILVVTSEHYISKFMHKHAIKINDSVVIENKVHLEPNKIRIPKQRKAIKVFGYFGLIRCERSLEILYNYLEISEDSKLIIYGYFQGISESLKLKIISHKRVSYLGMYKSPDDLNKIYKGIDISWIAYPYSSAQDGNFKYARTNRFYEAGYFCIPMIANKDSGDAFYVDKYKCGLNIDLRNIEGSVKSLLNINFDDIENWKNNLIIQGSDEFRSTDDDYFELLEKL